MWSASALRMPRGCFNNSSIAPGWRPTIWAQIISASAFWPTNPSPCSIESPNTMKAKKKVRAARLKPVRNPEKPRRRAKSATRATVRMYRQGLGDCFLISLSKENGDDYFILIDCGVILGTSESTQKMQEVVKDIIATTDGHLDLLIATHEHWDHLSGFYQARELFKAFKGKVGEVWLAWTEDPHDQLARELRSEHTALRATLAASAARMRMAGAANSVVDGMLEFFGAAGQGTTADALAVIRSLCDTKTVRYCR